MVQLALNQVQITGSQRSLAERLAAEAREEGRAEPTVSSMAERFAPDIMKSANGVPSRPMLEPGMVQSQRPETGLFCWPKPGMFAVLTAVALVPAGILAGLLWLGSIRSPDGEAGVYSGRQDSPLQEAAVAAAPVLEIPRAAPDIALSAPDQISAKAGETIRFPIAIDSTEALPPRSVIAIRDMPKGATFSQGRPYGTSEWSLRPDEIGDLRLQLPQGEGGSAGMRVELMAADGKVLARAATRLAIASDPKAALVLRSDESGRVEDLMVHGNKMVSVGYLAGARAYFKRAAEAGSGDAALALGATYDPAFIEEIGAQGIKADPDAAKTWYERAAVLGVNHRQEGLARLKQEWAQDSAPQPEAAAAQPETSAPPPVRPPSQPDADQSAGPIRRLVAAAADLTGKDEWVEVADAVNVRADPSGKILKVEQKGTKLRVIGREGNWVQVSDPATKNEGWVYTRFLQPSDAP
jgi:hypothetical protein